MGELVAPRGPGAPVPFQHLRPNIRPKAALQARICAKIGSTAMAVLQLAPRVPHRSGRAGPKWLTSATSVRNPSNASPSQEHRLSSKSEPRAPNSSRANPPDSRQTCPNSDLGRIPRTCESLAPERCATNLELNGSLSRARLSRSGSAQRATGHARGPEGNGSDEDDDDDPSLGSSRWRGRAWLRSARGKKGEGVVGVGGGDVLHCDVGVESGRSV